MGSRDNHVIDDQRHDELLLRLLERSGQPSVVPPPADLVTRTLRRLPQELPAIAGQAAARRTRRRSALRVTLALALALIGLLGIGSVLGGGPSLALMFGDGVSGISRVLLGACGMKRYILLMLLFGLWLAPGAALARAQTDAIVITAGQHVAGNVATIAQDIRVDGTVDGDVTSWNGAITIAGSVGGDVVSYGGAVTVMPTGQVAGHILASAGKLHQAPGAVVAGQKISGGAGEALASLLDLLNPAGPVDLDDTLGHALFGVALAVLLAAFWLSARGGIPTNGGATLAKSGPMVAFTLVLVLLIAVAVALAPLWGLALFFLVASPGLGAVVLSRGGMAQPLAAR